MASALVGNEWSASRPGRFTPRERSLGVQWTGASLDYMNDNTVPSRYTDCATAATTVSNTNTGWPKSRPGRCGEETILDRSRI
jgi:hypothetical protein